MPVKMTTAVSCRARRGDRLVVLVDRDDGEFDESPASFNGE